MEGNFLLVLEMTGPRNARKFKFYNPLTSRIQESWDLKRQVRAPYNWLEATLLHERLLTYKFAEPCFKDAYFLRDRFVIEDVVYTPPPGHTLLKDHNQVYCPRLGRVAIIDMPEALEVFRQNPDTAFEVQLVLLPWNNIEEHRTVWALKILYCTSEFKELRHVHYLPWYKSRRPGPPPRPPVEISDDEESEAPIDEVQAVEAETRDGPQQSPDVQQQQQANVSQGSEVERPVEREQENFETW